MIWQEDIEQSRRFRLLPQLVHQWWRLPSAASFKLCFHDRLCWDTLGFDPIEHFLNHVNRLGPKLRFRPWRNSFKGRVALHLDRTHDVVMLGIKKWERQ